MKIKLWAIAVCILFYALIIDMCLHLSTWRCFEPFAFFAVVTSMVALGRIIFGEPGDDANNGSEA
jgi:hypothetical protein